MPNKEQKNRKLNWLLKMAWRESRNQKSRLFLFISSVVVGIAALVAINSFRINMDASIETEAKTLLGADLVLRSNTSFSDTVYQHIDSLGWEYSNEVSFSSMAYFPKSGSSRLVRVRAVKGGFPFYGKVVTEPAHAFYKYNVGQHAMVDAAMMMQFSAESGDSIAIGELRFKISGGLKKIPGQTFAASTVAPTVFIPLEYLEQTGLVEFGSLVRYYMYLKTPAEIDINDYRDSQQPFYDKHKIRIRTVEGRRESLGRTSDNLTIFFNMIGVFALILGIIGVYSSISIYMQQKMQSVAVLRCLGATTNDVLKIYLVQTFLTCSW